eukprot:scaffold25685_cov127-Cylindrotheca_fusiformis.AAC.2
MSLVYSFHSSKVAFFWSCSLLACFASELHNNDNTSSTSTSTSNNVKIPTKIGWTTVEMFEQQHKQQLLGRSKILSNVVFIQTKYTREGGMTLYLKAGPNSSSVSDCPSAHAVWISSLCSCCMDYTVQPKTPESKPARLCPEKKKKQRHLFT